jgi:acid phosphatase
MLVLEQQTDNKQAAYLIRHAAIYANDFDYEAYISPFLQKLGNSTVDWRMARSLSFLESWQVCTKAHILKFD